MEDGKTDFGSLDVTASDVAKLLIAEFLLLYSNDWCLVPLELPIGSFSRILGLLVTDVFGDQFLVGPADANSDGEWPPFSTFRLAGDMTDQKGLFLAPSLASTMEAPAMERVEFLRDEMANMVWAIEQYAPSKLGEPVSLDRSAPPPQAGEVTEGVTARYRLGTTRASELAAVRPRAGSGLDTQHPAAARENARSAALAGRRNSERPGAVFHRRRGSAARGADRDAVVPARALDERLDVSLDWEIVTRRAWRGIERARVRSDRRSAFALTRSAYRADRRFASSWQPSHPLSMAECSIAQSWRRPEGVPLRSIPTRGQGSSKKGQSSLLRVLLREVVASLGSASLHSIRSSLMNQVPGVVVCDVLIRKAKVAFPQPRDDHF